ncbi:MAG: hypothetical protein ACPG4N_02775 [Gammaproteobacteria bacterium]
MKQTNNSVSGSLFSFSFPSLFGSTKTVTGPSFDFEASKSPNSARFSAQVNAADLTTTMPGGTSTSFSVGRGGAFGYSTNPQSGDTTFEISPFGKGKTGGSFTVSGKRIEQAKPVLESFSKHYATTSDPNF